MKDKQISFALSCVSLTTTHTYTLAADEDRIQCLRQSVNPGRKELKCVSLTTTHTYTLAADEDRIQCLRQSVNPGRKELKCTMCTYTLAADEDRIQCLRQSVNPGRKEVHNVYSNRLADSGDCHNSNNSKASTQQSPGKTFVGGYREHPLLWQYVNINRNHRQ